MIYGIGNIKKKKINIIDNLHFSVVNIRNVAGRLAYDYGIRACPDADQDNDHRLSITDRTFQYKKN